MPIHKGDAGSVGVAEGNAFTFVRMVAEPARRIKKQGRRGWLLDAFELPPTYRLVESVAALQLPRRWAQENGM